MELSRLFPKPLSSIGQRYRSFREFLAEVLEGNRSLLGEEERQEPAQAFEVISDFRHLGTRGLTPAEAFSALSPFFEVGAYLVQKNGATKLNGLFIEGNSFLNESDSPVVKLGLAELRPGRVVKGRLAPVLRALGLQGLLETKRLSSADVFAFSPTTGVVFLLICNRPALWQTAALEEAFRFATHAVAVDG